MRTVYRELQIFSDFLLDRDDNYRFDQMRALHYLRTSE